MGEINRNPNLIYLDELMDITGEDTPTKVINRLKSDGIKVFNVRGVRPYTTLQLMNAAGGLNQTVEQSSKDIL